jgi:catechol 2,3-dioxygenase-like lactoylglutathione lyase family enzyme
MSEVTGVSLRSIVFDCPDAVMLATFYRDLLGGRLDTGDPGWCEVRFDTLGFKLAFQQIDDYHPPEWPDGNPQQIHLDLTAGDIEVASARAVELGARRVKGPVDADGSSYLVHLDPAGHPFCFCQDGPR